MKMIQIFIWMYLKKLTQIIMVILFVAPNRMISSYCKKKLFFELFLQEHFSLSPFYFIIFIYI